MSERPTPETDALNLGSRHGNPWDLCRRLERQRDELVDACNGLLGLLQLIRSRPDCPPEIRDALFKNHRAVDARAVIAKVESK